MVSRNKYLDMLDPVAPTLKSSGRAGLPPNPMATDLAEPAEPMACVVPAPLRGAASGSQAPGESGELVNGIVTLW